MNEVPSLWRSPGTPERLTDSEVFAIIFSTEQKSLYDDVEVQISIGTDSQPLGEAFCFVSAVCLYRKGRGGTYYYKREVVRPRPHLLKNQKLRMLDEVYKSIEIALALREATGVAAAIHIDASPPSGSAFTSKFADQLRGYVISSGLECALKPLSYAANAVADRHTKKRQLFKKP